MQRSGPPRSRRLARQSRVNNALVGFERKIIDPAHAAVQAAQLPRPMVFTNGVFDVLQIGRAHV